MKDQQHTLQSIYQSVEIAIRKEKGVEVDEEPTKCVCRTNCIESPLRGYFERHGRYVAKHPYPFMFVPLIMTLCMGYGLRHLEVINDTEYLVTPKNGQSKSERRIIQEFFHVDQHGGFMPERSPALDGFLDIVISSKDESNILQSKHIESIIQLEELVNNVTVTDSTGSTYNYQDICASWKERNGEEGCMPMPLLKLIYENNPTNVDKTEVNYPKQGYSMKMENGMENIVDLFMGNILGNVTVENGTTRVTYARATRITFFLRYETATEQAKSDLWFTEVEKVLTQYENENIFIYHSATNSLMIQFDKASQDIAPKFAFPFILLILFSIFSCMMDDWVRSKPYLALMGVLSAAFSLATTFGLLAALGVKAVPQVGLVPFLTLGVGVDNMFIMISAWRRTDVPALAGLDMHKRVTIRMGESMKEAALSISITSLTDILAFGIGSITEFRTVEIFCLYTGMSILINYIFCITLFAAAMVFSGWREENNRHCFSLKKVHSKEEAIENGASWWYRIWCSGGKSGRFEPESYKETRLNTRLNILTSITSLTDEIWTGENHHIMQFFRNYFAPTIMKPWAKVCIMMIYGLYLAGAIWGCIHIRKGVSFEKLSNSDSSLADYYIYKDTYFNEYSVSVGIVITDHLDYSLPETQQRVRNVIETFTNETDYFSTDNTVSWLKDYNTFLSHAPRKPRNEREFNDILRFQFLNMQGADRYRLDVSFNPEATKILASRFYVQSLWYKKTEEIMLAARRVANSIDDVNVTIFHSTFIFFDQPVVVWKNTIQNIIIAIVAMFFVALMFVPQPMSALWITLATASIEAGVMGYMTLWNVNIDFISMTYLILCIGFSIDFTVHITYGFIASEATTGSDKAIDALFLLGWPIIQSGVSTLLSVVFLNTSISYLFVSFFKTMTLVICFGVWHALFVLPVVLSLLTAQCKPCTKKPDCQCECQCDKTDEDKGYYDEYIALETTDNIGTLSRHHTTASTSSRSRPHIVRSPANRESNRAIKRTHKNKSQKSDPETFIVTELCSNV